MLEQVRAIFMAFPEVTERLSHGVPSWFVRDKACVAYFWHSGHHDDERPQIWCAAPAGAQAELIGDDPGRYFRPPYVGHRGWVGVVMEPGPDWAEFAEVAQDAYRSVAPKKLIARLDQR